MGGGELFEQLRGTLGHEWDILILGVGSAVLYKAARVVQRQVERLLFVQILVGAVNEEELEEDDTNGHHKGGQPWMDPDDEGGGNRAQEYAMQQRQEDAQRLVEDVRAYAARRALESTNPLRWLFPLPKLRVTSAIDAQTLGDDDAEGPRELNANCDGVPLMAATVLPATGSSSVVVVEGVSLVRLPFVWLGDGGAGDSGGVGGPGVPASLCVPKDPMYMILNTALNPWARSNDTGMPVRHVIDRVRWCQRKQQ